MDSSYYFLYLTFSLSFIVFPSQCKIISNLEVVKESLDPNSDFYRTPPEILRNHGYEVEIHTIQSQDGYLLDYHRIPHAKGDKNCVKKYPVLLHHGIFGSSSDWLILGPGRALAYRLADECYDVWLANARGNTFARRHVHNKPSNKTFWDFSFHESGIYDLPAAIDLILNTTKAEKLIYIGHSLGTAAFFVLASERPEYNEKILFQFSMGPVFSLAHSTSLFRLAVPILNSVEPVREFYQAPFLGHNYLVSILINILCGVDILNSNACVQLIFASVFGESKEELDSAAFPMLTSNDLAGTSLKNTIHLAQLIRPGRFAPYDYGVPGNMKRYGAAKPPLYNLSNIVAPVRLYCGRNDILTDLLDAEINYQKLGKPMGLTVIKNPKWAHGDFIIGRQINKYLNDEVVDFVKNATSNPELVEQAVKQAIKERNENPAPKDPPFNEKDFIKSQVAQLPRLGDFLKANNIDLGFKL